MAHRTLIISMNVQVREPLPVVWHFVVMRTVFALAVWQSRTIENMASK